MMMNAKTKQNKTQKTNKKNSIQERSKQKKVDIIEAESTTIIGIQTHIIICFQKRFIVSTKIRALHNDT